MKSICSTIPLPRMRVLLPFKPGLLQVSSKNHKNEANVKYNLLLMPVYFLLYDLFHIQS